MRSSNKERKIRKLRTELDCCCVATLNKLNNILVIGRYMYISHHICGDLISFTFCLSFVFSFFLFVDAFIIHLFMYAR